MILGEKVYNGSWTMLDPYNLDPQGVPFKTLSIWGYLIKKSSLVSNLASLTSANPWDLQISRWNRPPFPPKTNEYPLNTI